MKYSALLAMAAAAVAAPTVAGTVVNAAAGEACRVTEPGAFSCIWTDADGQTTRADGVTGLTAPRDGLFGGYLRVEEVPLDGWIEVGLPYALTEFKYPTWADRIFAVGGISAKAVDRDHRAVGRIYYGTGFFDDVCWDFSCFSRDPMQLSAIYLGGTRDYFRTSSGSGAAEGIWVASMKWAFRADAPAAHLSLSSRITVPEPVSWALMIAGFGVVGLSLRRRRGARGNAAPG